MCLRRKPSGGCTKNFAEYTTLGLLSRIGRLDCQGPCLTNKVAGCRVHQWYEGLEFQEKAVRHDESLPCRQAHSNCPAPSRFRNIPTPACASDVHDKLHNGYLPEIDKLHVGRPLERRRRVRSQFMVFPTVVQHLRKFGKHAVYRVCKCLRSSFCMYDAYVGFCRAPNLLYLYHKSQLVHSQLV
jgi:hypothetical protein